MSAINFVKELSWRGMLHDITPGTEDALNKGLSVGYAGFDPTASSLQIGNLIPVMMLLHLQRCGHKPLALVGGATAMIGDPSGKSEERNLMDIEEIRYNAERFKLQLQKFLTFGDGPTDAELVNNYDWFSEFRFLDFLRDVGKHLTVSYMMAKDSVKTRLEGGISFTEFSYQLLQGYDYFWLNKNKNCVLQIGGSDQWGNITSGCELIRRMGGGDVYSLTCPLLTKADGTKFGKSAAGEKIFLDPELTSPYKFYQFWLNCADNDAARFIKVFTLFSQEQIADLEEKHAQAPHQRLLQKELAKDLTMRVHSETDYTMALEASQILFGKGTSESLKKLSERDLLSIFEGVPQFTIPKTELEAGITIVDLMTEKSSIFGSKGEARRMLKGGGVAVNKEKISSDDFMVTTDHLLSGKYLLVQKGKKNFNLGTVS